MSTEQFQTKGHRADAPGLRGHSCGEMYPYTVIAIGRGPQQTLSWAAMDCRTGNTGREFRSYQEAVLDIAGLKVRNLINE